MVTVANKRDLYDEIIAKARRIGEVAESEAALADQNSTISENVVKVIREEQINRLLLPKEYGYPQIDWTTYVDFVKTIGNYNLSAAWIGCFYSLHNAWVSYLPKSLRDEVVNQGGFVADVFAPVGKVEKVDGGYILNAHYKYVSGIAYSDWVGVGAMMKFEDSDKPERVGICLKVSDCTIVKDWDSMGLRGSGSHTLLVDNVFVKPEAIIRFHKVVENPQPPEADFDQDYLYYNAPFYPGFYVGFAAMALGGAERVVEEFKKSTVGRVRFTGVKENESPTSQRVLAELSLELQQTQLLMKEYVAMMEQDRNDPTNYEGTKYKAMRAVIINKSVNIGVKALLTLGASALLKGHPVEMMTRDLIAIATHITSLYEDGIHSYGRHLFGFETGTFG